MRPKFMLDPEWRYLNHGSFGALSVPVFEANEAVRREAEMQPGIFMQEAVMGRVRKNIAALGPFIGADPDNLVFVENATSAINAVLRSLVLMPGDEVLTTSNVYNAVRKTLEFVTERASARLVIAEIPFPMRNTGEIVDAIMAAITARTRLVVVDHVTSETAITMPLGEIIEQVKERGIPVLVDGAHAPGMLRLSLENLGATYYAGNCHKWLGSPRGCGFLWTDPEYQRRVRPNVISHYINEGYHRAFDWPGSKDFSAWLSVEAAIAFRATLGEGDIYAYCRPLAARAARHLAAVWETETGTPQGAMSFMSTVALPWTGTSNRQKAELLRSKLRERHKTETFIRNINGRLWLRVSAFVYNDISEYSKLGEIIPQMLDEL